jgi:hypothetical protein
LLSNVATSVMLFGKFAVQFVLSDQTLLAPPSQVAELACAGALDDARTVTTEAARKLSGFLLEIIRYTD